MIEYYKCIKTNTPDFTKNKIYKIIDPSNLEAPLNFIDECGNTNGWCGNNYEHFKPVTEKEWCEQENIKLDYSYLIKIFKKLKIT